MNAVTVNCKSFRYDGADNDVLHDTLFTVDYGKVTLLSGPSGCGKSTLLSLINGIIPRMTVGQFNGSVTVDGEDISKKTMSQISLKVGSVLQNAEAQIIHQTVEDETAFGCENVGIEPSEIEKRVEQSCRLVKLERDWKTRTLSGGQKQRVVTASTLAMQPNILIFDEPLANLDKQGATELLEMLKSLAHSGKAVLLIEHRLDIVLPYADSVWELKDGKAEKVRDKKSYLKSQTNIIKDNLSDFTHSSNAILSIDNISKKFGTRNILNGINFEILSGERVLLLGENGCGKSTLMSIIARLLKCDSGEIRQSIDPSLGKRACKRWFREVGIVYQNPNYQLFMPTVEEEISFGCDNREYALKMAEYFGLTDLLERHPQSLSEGQKRRVTVAAILAQKPRLLLLDEPTVGQDYNNLKKMINVINEIHREQQNTMITVTHDFRCAAALCDKAVWINDGKIIKSGGKELVSEFFLTESVAF